MWRRHVIYIHFVLRWHHYKLDKHLIADSHSPHIYLFFFYSYAVLGYMLELIKILFCILSVKQAMGDEFDGCECVWSHEYAMQRLLAMVSWKPFVSKPFIFAIIDVRTNLHQSLLFNQFILYLFSFRYGRAKIIAQIRNASIVSFWWLTFLKFIVNKFMFFFKYRVAYVRPLQLALEMRKITSLWLQC